MPLLQAIIEQEDYHTVHIKDAKANMHWQFALHEKENNEKIMGTPAIFNRMPGLDVGSNKRRLALIMRHMQEHYPSQFDFTPATFVLPTEKEMLQLAMEKSKRAWILKPSSGSEGCGIILAMKFKDIPSFVMQSDYVAQEYLADPLLIDDKKFDLRIYVLVTSVAGEMNAFIADEGLVRLCTKNYEKPD